jgi:hypothetical protein
VSPALLPDGQVVYTEWRHMGMINDGHLRMMNTDMTGMREAFGGEVQSGPTTNSYLKARYVQTTQIDDGNGGKTNNYQMVAVATSRDRTLQSGKLLLLDLNGSEASSTPRDITPLVPGGEDPSSLGVGRYYDAEPVGQGAPGRFLVSWADGPVESETLALAGTNAQFGVYVYDINSRQRFPIYDALNYWDILARPLKSRPEPQGSPLTPVSPLSAQDTTIGALNVYDTSLGDIRQNLTPGRARGRTRLTGAAWRGLPALRGWMRSWRRPARTSRPRSQRCDRSSRRSWANCVRILQRRRPRSKRCRRRPSTCRAAMAGSIITGCCSAGVWARRAL